MKQVITIMAIAAAGTIGLASCTTSAQQQKQAALEAQVEALKMEVAKKQIVDSMNEVAKLQFVVPQQIPQQVVAATPLQEAKPKVIYKTRTVYARAPRRSSSASRNYANQYTGYSQPQQQVQAQPYYQAEPVHQKRGWSAKAKGAAIGGGAGALAGALIGQQKGKGAIIGGLLGAAGGLGVGAILDNKNGR